MKRARVATAPPQCHFPHRVATRESFFYVVPQETKVAPFSSCPQGHTLCRHHMDVVCHLDVENLSWSDGDAELRKGCPVCAGVCPCASCVGISPHLRPYGPGQRAPRQLVFAFNVADRPLPPLGDAQPFRVRLSEFTDKLFEDVVIQQRLPLVLTHVDEAVAGDGLWDLPRQLRARYYNEECPPTAKCQVRVQGISDKDPGLFTVLEELVDVDPRLFFLQTVANGSSARLLLSNEFRDSAEGRCAWYLKDWNFGAWQPEWTSDLFRVLPSRLTPRNDYDLLGGLVGQAEVQVMMAYMGAGGTRTPLHIDKAGSIAFNCVMWAEDESSCKRWWVFHPEDRAALDALIKKEVSTRNHLMEDSHWLDPHCFSSIPGLRHPVVSFEQRVGEMVIVPPNSPHTVRNQGGLTFAVAANFIDATVAQDAHDVQQANKKLQVRSVYKVCGAVWGTMERQWASERPVMRSVLDVCKVILEQEKAGIQRMDGFPTSEKDSSHEFVNMVTCDHCNGDIFNSYLFEKRTDRTFCPDEACVAFAVASKASLVKVVPISAYILERNYLAGERSTWTKNLK